MNYIQNRLYIYFLLVVIPFSFFLPLFRVTFILLSLTGIDI
ncbi:hypothetical protein [Pleionea sediminis]|nr:hypothetical protein [Pleionea sediminis]